MRCTWSTTDSLSTAYHDAEWGVPVYDDRALFELLVLEGAQAGLSWLTILKKREAYREAFDNFEVAKIACYGDAKLERLLTNPDIVRNRQKIYGTVQNARACLAVTNEFGEFHKYLWQFTGDRPVQNAWKHANDVPASTPLSDLLSKDLKKRGFTFVGTTICYAFMQATGMVNDHLVSCYRYAQVKKL